MKKNKELKDKKNYETSSESVSNFMRWIERRLEQEVTANETYAKTTKSSKPSVIPPQANNGDHDDFRYD